MRPVRLPIIDPVLLLAGQEGVSLAELAYHRMPPGTGTSRPGAQPCRHCACRHKSVNRRASWHMDSRNDRSPRGHEHGRTAPRVLRVIRFGGSIANLPQRVSPAYPANLARPSGSPRLTVWSHPAGQTLSPLPSTWPDSRRYIPDPAVYAPPQRGCRGRTTATTSSATRRNSSCFLLRASTFTSPGTMSSPCHAR